MADEIQDRAEKAEVAVIIDLQQMEGEGLHIQELGTEEEEPATDGLDDDHTYDWLESLIDGFAEAYNAHDLDGVTELLSTEAELPGLGHDLAGFPSSIEQLWDERPNAVLTRGRLEDRAVAVLWDVGEGGAWMRVALFDFDAADEDGQLGLVELIDDAVVIEQAQTEAPEPDLVEGARWEEWYEGDGG